MPINNVSDGDEIHDHSSQGDGNNGSSRNITGTINVGFKDKGSLPLDGNNDATQFQLDTDEEAGYEWLFQADTSLPSSVDMDSDHMVLVGGWQFNAPNRMELETLANGGMWVRFFSGGNGNWDTEYRRYIIAGIDSFTGKSQTGVNVWAIDCDASPDSSVGSFDNTDVRGWVFGMHANQVAVGNAEIWTFITRTYSFTTAKNSSRIPYFTGTSSWDDFITEIQGTSRGTKIHQFIQRLTPSLIFLSAPWQIGDGGSTVTNFNDNGDVVLFPGSADPSDPRYHITFKAFRGYVFIGSGDSVVLSGGVIYNNAETMEFDVGGSGTLTLNDYSIEGAGDCVFDGSGISGTISANLSPSARVIISGADLDGSTITGDVNLKGSTVTTLTDMVITGALDFDTAGTYNLVDCTVEEVTNSSGGAVTLNLTNSTVNTNTGPSITVVSLATVTFTGIPIGAEFRVYDDDLDGNEITIGTDREGIETAVSGTYVVTHDTSEAGNKIFAQVIDPGNVEEQVIEVTLLNVDQSREFILTPESNV